MVAASGFGLGAMPVGAQASSSSAPCAAPWDFLGLINTSRTRIVRNNERYLAFSPAVSQAFLVHSGEVRHKIVGHENVTLEIKKFLTYYTCILFRYTTLFSTKRLNIRKDI